MIHFFDFAAFGLIVSTNEPILYISLIYQPDISQFYLPKNDKHLSNNNKYILINNKYLSNNNK